MEIKKPTFSYEEVMTLLLEGTICWNDFSRLYSIVREEHMRYTVDEDVQIECIFSEMLRAFKRLCSGETH